MADKNTNTGKPSMKDYLKTLAPDFSVLDMVEQYGAQHNINKEFKDLFLYMEYVPPEGIQTSFYRFCFKYEGSLDLTENVDYVSFEDEKYCIIISNSPIKIKGATFICGVAF